MFCYCVSKKSIDSFYKLTYNIKGVWTHGNIHAFILHCFCIFFCMAPCIIERERESERGLKEVGACA